MSDQPSPAIPVKIVVCPQCGGDSLYAPNNLFRPFCSERCKNIDFGAWASEGFRLGSDAPAADEDDANPKLQ